MGCVSSKRFAVEDGIGVPRERPPDKTLSRVQSSIGEGGPQMIVRSNSRTSLIDRKLNSSVRVYEDRVEKSRVNPEDSLLNHSVTGSVAIAREGEHVVSAWPSWLVAAAGEALDGWVPRRVDSFQKLDKIGEGTYSSVYRAQDLINGKTVALKRVRFDNMDCESVKFMAREILILRRLDHPNIIKLEGIIASGTSSTLYLVFEYMDHDLTGLTSLPGLKFTEPQIKCFMQQLLSGLEHCHSNGVLHRDIKGSNLLIDGCGTLKIADFGLATFYSPHKRVPLTSRVVTLWYRPPELLLGATHYGASVDLWSAGCILGELYSGKPIMPGRTEVEQLHKIFRLCGSPPEEYWERLKLPHSTAFKPQKPYRRRVSEKFQDISAPALALIETLLAIDPASRGTVNSALKSEFFTTEPLACDPSTLPKHPPTKEIDARRREEENRRSRALEGKRDRIDQGKQGPPELVDTLSAKVNAEFVSSLQKKKDQFSSKAQNELFGSQHESTSGDKRDATKDSQAVKGVSKEIFDRLYQQGMHSGPLTSGRSITEKKLKGRPSFSRISNISTASSLFSNKNLVTENNHGNLGFQQNRGPTKEVRSSNWLDYSDSYMDSHQLVEKSSSRRAALHSYAPDDDRMHLSGPLLHPSRDLDKLLKEHDRKIQETARRARNDKSRHSKLLGR